MVGRLPAWLPDDDDDSVGCLLGGLSVVLSWCGVVLLLPVGLILMAQHWLCFMSF